MELLEKLLKKDGNYKAVVKFDSGRIGEYEVNGNVSYFQCVNGMNKFYRYRVLGKKIVQYDKTVISALNMDTGWQKTHPANKEYYNTNLFVFDFGREHGAMKCIGADDIDEGIEFLFENYKNTPVATANLTLEKCDIITKEDELTIRAKMKPAGFEATISFGKSKAELPKELANIK